MNRIALGDNRFLTVTTETTGDESTGFKTLVTITENNPNKPWEENRVQFPAIVVPQLIEALSHIAMTCTQVIVRKT